MDHLPGPNLSQVIAKLAAAAPPTPGALAAATGCADFAHFTSYPEAAARFLLPVFDALTAAHDAGLVHRDVKPSNVLLDVKGNPHIADFGLAKGEGDIGLTLSGEPVGTPCYMAPEQVAATATAADARTDVYSLGVTLYELLTLRRPFEAPTYSDLANRILSCPAPRPRQGNKAISKSLEAVVLRALAKNPDDRYATVAAFRDDLERALTGGPVLARRGWFVPSRPFAGRRVFAPGLYMGYEYRSSIEIFGLPLIHMTSGWDPMTGRLRKAVGIVAIGNQAYGVVAIGGFAFGVVSLGGVGVGLLLAFGGLAIGGIAFGGAAAGGVAIGGGALGYYAVGGGAVGTHVVTPMRQDPEAVETLRMYVPFVLDWLRLPRGN
jgi:hypothetical protein